MKELKIRNIESLFRKKLSEKSLAKEGLEVPDIWSDIEGSLPKKRNKLFPYFIIGLLLSLALSGVLFIADDETQETNIKTEFIGASFDYQKTNHDADQAQSPSVTVTTAKNTDLENRNQIGIKKYEAGVNQSGDAQKSFFDGLSSEKQVIVPIGIHTLPSQQGFTTDNQFVTSVEQLQKRSTALLAVNPIRAVINPLQFERSDRFSFSNHTIAGDPIKSDLKRHWFLRSELNVSSNTYLIRGNLNSDVNTSFTNESGRSFNYGLFAGRSIDENWIVELGLRYRNISTISNYAFSIAYPRRLETVVGDAAVMAVEHNIPSIGGGLDATTELRRDLGDEITEGDIVILEAVLEEQVQAIEFPLFASLRIPLLNQLEARAKFGASMKLAMGDLSSKVKSLQTDNTAIQYENLEVFEARDDALNSVSFDYHFGAQLSYQFKNSPFLLDFHFMYQNGISPLFEFDTKKVFPKSIGGGVGVTFKFQD